MERAGYSEKRFEEISLQAFHSPAIRETMSIWETYGTLPTSKAASEAINSLKFRFPRIKSWKASKILQSLSTNWHQRDQIQNRLNLERMEFLKKEEFNERMKENKENKFVSNKVIDDTTMEELVKESELNWDKAAEFTRYSSEAPPIITVSYTHLRAHET